MINCFGMPWNRTGTLSTRRSIIMDGVKNFRIDPDRLWDSLMEMAKIGPGVAGGNNRQTLTVKMQRVDHYLKPGVKTLE